MKDTQTSLENVMCSPSLSQVGQFWLPDDRKTPNIEGLDGVSIETDLMRKGHCQRFFSEKGRRIIRGGSETRTKKNPSVFTPPPPNEYFYYDKKNVGFK